MKRPIAVSNASEEALTLPFTSSHKLSHSYRDENSSPYHSYNNTHTSDTESLSDSSKKIRKKRNTYQKISDDIRVDLLESVQNGETLKAAAKRHKINYSSAKSILHTYRKEGRILKKSAQERTIKRKSSATEETKQSAKILKSCKKDNIKVTPKSSRFARSRSFNPEKIKTESVDSAFQDKDEVKTATTASDKNCNSLSKTDYYLPEQEEKSDYQPLTIAPTYHMNHPTFIKEEESAIKMLLNPENRGLLEANHGHRDTLKNIGAGHAEYEEENSANRYRLFDNLYVNHNNVHLPEVGNVHMYGESPERAHNFLPKEFESFNDMINPLQTRSSHFEEYYHNSNSFLNPRRFNTFPNIDDKYKRAENRMDYESHDDHSIHFSDRSFMDPQRFFQENLAKTSLMNYNGNVTGYRKKSHEFY